ncbi:hypothetical protein EV356DRAFT_508262 [Viridothelium virens]|uniref:Retrovirus-related Pol polyprotein from transposon TNT 1-94-like beta-barrel domain-containing protein n=1 Tax=Viridothelium virens TaxID=1048519 RepID=A0A6A6GYK0_VIRVR|nr:hypothetical protein EV356DRAFT_508262 [Viridothelium virens]
MGDIGEYWRDVRKQRKRRHRKDKRHKGKQQEKAPHNAKPAIESPQPESPDRRCYDWMIVGGFCSYARDRNWFSDYQPIDQIIGDGMRVKGIGTVRIKVKRSPESDETRTLVLNPVLHLPTAKCNGFKPDEGQSSGWSTVLRTEDETGAPL